MTVMASPGFPGASPVALHGASCRLPVAPFWPWLVTFSSPSRGRQNVTRRRHWLRRSSVLLRCGGPGLVIGQAWRVVAVVLARAAVAGFVLLIPGFQQAQRFH